MEGAVAVQCELATKHPITIPGDRSTTPFSLEQITITKQEYIELRHQASYWESQHSRAKGRIETLEEEIA